MNITAADIEPGDLLLFHGDGFVSWAIRKIDGSEVNHAAVALGGGMLAEAEGGGLRTRPIPAASDGREYILVRRHLAPDPRDPVLSIAQKYLEERNFYAYQQIVLLAILGITRRIPAPDVARRMLRSALDHAARALIDLLPVGKSWMICSEYAYRCFDESAAAPPKPFAIGIQGLTYALPESTDSRTWLEWAFAEEAPVDLVPIAASFAAPAVDPAAAAEAELAPLIAEWAQFAGVDDADPLPVPADLSFDVPDPGVPAADAAAVAAEQKRDIPDDELRNAMVRFATTLDAVQAIPAGIPAEFGVVATGIGAAAARGALDGLRRISVDPNFVTPRDLFVSNSFDPPRRLQ